MAEKLRIREPGKHALLNPETLNHESPRLDDRFDEDHPLVKAHRWAFGTDAEIAEAAQAAREVTSVSIAGLVEEATAVPGQARRTRRQA